MKKNVLTIAIVAAAIMTTACGGRKAQETTTTDAKTEVVENEVVKSTVTDSQGKAIILTFDNAKGTASIEFDGETIQLKRDTTASGIRLHNDEYKYEEWQGHSILYKNDEVVFDNKK